MDAFCTFKGLAMGRPQKQEIEAAARVLLDEGNKAHWWPGRFDYDDLDAAGKAQLYGLVERMLLAAAQRRTG